MADDDIAVPPPRPCAKSPVIFSCAVLSAEAPDIFSGGVSEEADDMSLHSSQPCAEAEESCIGGSSSSCNSTTKSVTTSVSLPTIYLVPQRIRQRKKDASEPYEPQIVSIGPIHHIKESLKGFEEHKRRYQDSILSRNRNHQLEDYHEAIAKLERKARSCYSDNVGPEDSDEYVEMMVLDGCFIVELFLRFKQKKEKQKEELEQTEEFSLKQNEEKPKVDLIFHTIWMLPLIMYDVLLLENQIPFFVLQCIFEMVCPGNGSLAKLALDFFESIMPRNKEIHIKHSYSYHHLLHLFHSHLMPTPRKKSNKWKKLLVFLRSEGFLPCSNKTQLPISNKDPVTIKMIPCVADLELAGVKFKKKKDFNSILDVEFSHGVFKIPRLLIDDHTNTLFRNLVAFEQCCYPRAKIRFTTYLRFMDCLVNTSKDVAMLHRNGIIDHLLGSDEDVAHLFNHLCCGIFDLKDNYLSGLFKDVDKHYNTQWNMWWASFRRDYCINPCTFLTSVAAVILIAVTILQTVYTVYPYYRPRS